MRYWAWLCLSLVGLGRLACPRSWIMRNWDEEMKEQAPRSLSDMNLDEWLESLGDPDRKRETALADHIAAEHERYEGDLAPFVRMLNDPWRPGWDAEL